MLNVARVAIMGCCILIKMSTFAPQKTTANKIMDDYHAENFNL